MALLEQGGLELYIVSHPFQFIILFITFLIWVLIWKGIALWKAAHNHQRNWFIVLLIVNTVGLLEIFYIFFIARKKEQKTAEE